MRTRNCIPALLVLASLLLCACESPDGSSSLGIGNMVTTVAPSNPGTRPGLSGWTGSVFAYEGSFDANGGSFEIETVDGWYTLEDTTQIKLVHDGGTEFLTLLDSSGNEVAIKSVVTQVETAFAEGEATLKLLTANNATGEATYSVTLKFLNSIHVLTVRTKP